MIHVTIRTLESENYEFDLDDNITVSEFKEKITARISLSVDKQRLIFKGKVLQDNKILQSYGVHEQVIHMVERPPPSNIYSSTESHSSPTINEDPSTSQPRVFLGTVDIPFTDGNFDMSHFENALHQFAHNLTNQYMPPSNNQAMPIIQNFNPGSSISSPISNSDQLLNPPPHTLSFSKSRLEIAQNMLKEAKKDIEKLNNSESSSADIIQTQTPSTSHPTNTNLNENPEDHDYAANSTINHTITETNSDILSRTFENRPKTDAMADIIHEYSSILTAFLPHLMSTSQSLRRTDNIPDLKDRQRIQLEFSLVSRIMHYLSHAQHAMSDIVVDFAESDPRYLRAAVLHQAVVPVEITVPYQLPPFVMPSANNNMTSQPLNISLNLNNNSNSTIGQLISQSGPISTSNVNIGEEMGARDNFRIVIEQRDVDNLFTDDENENDINRENVTQMEEEYIASSMADFISNSIERQIMLLDDNQDATLRTQSDGMSSEHVIPSSLPSQPLPLTQFGISSLPLETNNQPHRIIIIGTNSLTTQPMEQPGIQQNHNLPHIVQSPTTNQSWSHNVAGAVQGIISSIMTNLNGSTSNMIPNDITNSSVETSGNQPLRRSLSLGNRSNRRVLNFVGNNTNIGSSTNSFPENFTLTNGMTYTLAPGTQNNARRIPLSLNNNSPNINRLTTSALTYQAPRLGSTRRRTATRANYIPNIRPMHEASSSLFPSFNNNNILFNHNDPLLPCYSHHFVNLQENEERNINYVRIQPVGATIQRTVIRRNPPLANFALNNTGPTSNANLGQPPHSTNVLVSSQASNLAFPPGMDMLPGLQNMISSVLERFANPRSGSTFPDLNNTSPFSQLLNTFMMPQQVNTSSFSGPSPNVMNFLGALLGQFILPSQQTDQSTASDSSNITNPSIYDFLAGFSHLFPEFDFSVGTPVTSSNQTTTDNEDQDILSRFVTYAFRNTDFPTLQNAYLRRSEGLVHFNRLIRNFITREVSPAATSVNEDFNVSNVVPSKEDLVMLMDRMEAELEPFLDEIFRDLPTIEDIDLSETVLKYINSVMTYLLITIFLMPQDQTGTPFDMISLLTSCAQQLNELLCCALTQPSSDLPIIIRRSLNSSSSSLNFPIIGSNNGAENFLTGIVMDWLQSCILTSRENIDTQEAQFLRYFYVADNSSTSTNEYNEGQGENARIVKKATDSVSSQQNFDEPSKENDKRKVDYMDIEDEEDSFEDALNYLHKAENKNMHKNNKTNGRPIVEQSDSWKNHLPKEWINTIEDDINKINGDSLNNNEVGTSRSLPTDNAEPVLMTYSDAYISGMPLKRRKMMENFQNTRLCSPYIDVYLRDMLEKSLHESGILLSFTEFDEMFTRMMLDENLLKSFRTMLADKMKNSINKNAIYEPSKYPHIKDFVNDLGQ
ncbi:uncharacterized protein LOC135922794 isoform X2 [Gordionus sp. m RMFG-2023]|uniref:uncharacterized protein LOC135922794 isoform X2 n=1 Tax=Gordionus sp. m RMFG-2023 TaxID=3053472 RepID=UPI0031FC366C